MLLVYFFGGVTKINRDYLVDAQPLKLIMSNSPLAKVGGTAAEFMQNDFVAYFLSYSGLVYDLAIGVMLLCRRTRILGVVLTTIFHGTNHFFLFDDIGWYPLLGIIATTIFLEPDWPSRFGVWLRRPVIKRPDWKWFSVGFFTVPVVGVTLGWKLKSTAPWQSDRPASRWSTAVVVMLLIVSFLVPFDHYFIPGDVNWTGQGDFFSWRMKAVAKGSTRLLIKVDDQGRRPPDQLTYRDLDARHIRWRELPEFMVTYDPILGKRLVYNRMAGGRSNPLPEKDMVLRVTRLWQQRFGRTPQIIPPRPFSEIFEDVNRSLSDDERYRRVLGQLKALESVARQLQYNELSAFEFKKKLLTLQISLSTLLRDRQAQQLISNTLASAPPYWMPIPDIEQQPVAYIGDPLLWQGAKGKDLTRDHTSFSGLFEKWNYVWADFERFSHSNFLALPRTIAFEDRQGKSFWLWNQVHDLNRWQFEWIGKNPIACHRYVKFVATQWEEVYGFRPRIYVETAVWMNHHEVAPMIDESVDLASVPFHYWKKNAWILPHQSSVPDDPTVD